MKKKYFLVLLTLLLVSCSTADVVSTLNISREEFVYIPSGEVNPQQAIDAMIEAEKEISEMNKLNLTTYYVKDLLFRAQKSFIGPDTTSIVSFARATLPGPRQNYVRNLYAAYYKIPSEEFFVLNYSGVLYYTQQISFRKDEALYIMDIIEMMSKKVSEYNASGFDVTRAAIALNLSKEAFNAERYDEAKDYLQQTDLKLQEAKAEKQRLKRIAELSKNFIQKYWIELVAALILIIIFIQPAIKRIRMKTAKKKVEHMKVELKVLKDMLKDAQRKCFVQRKITVDTYSVRENRYKQKIADIKQKLPVYEAMAKGDFGKTKEEPKENNKTNLKI